MRVVTIMLGLALAGVAGAQAGRVRVAAPSLIVFSCDSCPGSEAGPGRLYTIHTDGRALRALKPVRAGSYWPAWSPGGKSLAFASLNPAEVWISRSDGSRARPVLRPPNSADDESPTWSPNGRRIAFVRVALATADEPRTSLWVANRDGTRPRMVLSMTPNLVYPAWSPDGRWIAFNDIQERLYVARANGSGRRRVAPGVSGRKPAWSPDGRRIAFVDVFHARIDVLDRATGRVRTVYRWASGGPDSVTWSPNGRWLAALATRPVDCSGPYACATMEIRLIRVADGRSRVIFTQPEGEPYGIDWRR